MRLLAVALFCLFSVQACSQPQPASKEFTTFVLVRHAEKESDGTKDPDLTMDGKKRADALVAVLNETKIDAVYSTAFKRTKNTAAPIAEVKALSVLTYEAFKESVIDSMLVKHRGETVVLVGHSNSIPWTANYLLGEKRFSDFVDSDYNNLLLISVLEKGTASVIWLNFGSPK